jgi:hypothetical protein
MIRVKSFKRFFAPRYSRKRLISEFLDYDFEKLKWNFFNSTVLKAAVRREKAGAKSQSS